MIGQSEELIQDKNKDIMKAIIGMLHTKKQFLRINLAFDCTSCLFYITFTIQR